MLLFFCCLQVVCYAQEFEESSGSEEVDRASVSPLPLAPAHLVIVRQPRVSQVIDCCVEGCFKSGRCLRYGCPNCLENSYRHFNITLNECSQTFSIYDNECCDQVLTCGGRIPKMTAFDFLLVSGGGSFCAAFWLAKALL